METSSIVADSQNDEVVLDDETSTSSAINRTLDDIAKEIKCGKLTVRKKAGKSDIWERFSMVFDGKIKLNFVQCNNCSKILKYSTLIGNSHLNRHQFIRSALPGQQQLKGRSEIEYKIIFFKNAVNTYISI